MKPVIEVSNISKSYNISHQAKASYGTIKEDFAQLIKKPLGRGRKDENEIFWALKDINFEVNQGEALGIIGKNGSGKSTLLKILSRIVDPTTGTIKMHGRIASLLEVGTGFHPELTGRENIYFNGSMIGMSKSEIDRKFNEIVDFSEVERFLDTPVKFYSSGMYVRLAFAVAAHLESEVLIIDEVLAVGDASFQKKSLDKMLSIAKEGRTILFVSHSMSSIEELCDRAILLQSGTITKMGKTESVAEAYLEENVIGGLGAAPRDHSERERVDESYGRLVFIKNLQTREKEQKFYFGDSLNFRLSIGSKKSTPNNVFFGIGVTEPNGRRIFTYESLDEINLHGTHTNVDISISSPQLQPGIYYVDVGIRSGAKTLDFIPQAITFRVNKEDRLGNLHSPLNDPASSGYIVPVVKVKVSK